LLLGQAKLAGVLLEREGDAVIVGIGVNLAFAPELADRATVALSAFGPAPDRNAFADSLAAAFDRELERWRTYGLEPMLRRWQSVGHPEGTRLSVHEADGARVAGAYAGLAEDGSLLLRLDDGSTRAVHAGDVELA
jgi:BirA family biotin operon repressor/biotin-[acetyl-CoA-carboxylase] ligase